jgi:hypothetical protein
MAKVISRELTQAQLAELKSLASRPDREIDTSDASEILNWSGARRGLFHRPPKQKSAIRSQTTE